MSGFVSGGLSSAFTWVVRVQKDACTHRLFISEETRNPAIEATDIDPHSEFEFEQTDDVLNRSNPQTQALAKLECIQFGLLSHVARQYRSLRWIVPGPLDAEEVLQFDLRPCQVGEELRRGGDGIV